MRLGVFTAAASAALLLSACSPAPEAPAAPTAAAPALDAEYPPALVEMSFKVEGDRLNGIVYLANDPGPHPAVVLLHGFPGNERNLDLAQDLRREGFNVLFFHYRGAWGSEGEYSLPHVIEDAGAAATYLRENADKLRTDPARILLVGHSMGGFAALQAAARDPAIKCAAGLAPAEMGAIVEAFVEGDIKRSPSVQFRITPAREVEAISSHDQVLGGEGEQVFLGCQFPADDDYRLTIEAEGRKAAAVLCERGVLGRFGIDFISVKDGKDWRHYAIEINLRKGGTTHPQIMLQFLTDGRYDPESGLFFAPGGRPRYYYASDNIESERYRGLTPQDLMDIALKHGIHFHQATQKGVVFHLIGALSEFGKLGAVCVGESRAESRRLYDEMITILDRESAGS